MYVGDTIVFDVSNQNYPVYVKDSLLNTDPNFDYTEFRNLATTITSGVTVSSFAFTFIESGTYVFSMSSNPTTLTIVTILDSNIAQSTEAQFVPMSESNLIVSGVKTTSGIVLAPDWDLVAGLLAGMLGMVLLVTGFLYYFRKRAWSTKSTIQLKYRDLNKNGDYDAKAQGTGVSSTLTLCCSMAPGPCGCLSTNNKVFATDESSHHDKQKVGDDLEAAAFRPDEEVEFDDEMLLPELAKHMQSHHDEIDRQLLTQNDMLTNLQDTLKKEVDELKQIMAQTSMELAMSTTNMEQKNKRVSAILIQLKTDTLARGVYENSFDTTDKRIFTCLDQVRSLLTDGADNVARNIVEDITHQGLALFERDEPVTGITSSLMHQASDFLQQIGEYVNTLMIPAVDEEKRRVRASEDAFDSAVRSLHNVVFPGDVLECRKTSQASDVATDSQFDSMLSLLRSFSDHVPQFVQLLQDAESDLNRGIARTVDKGNSALVEKEKELSIETFRSLLDDLKTALSVLSGALVEKLSASVESMSAGQRDREALIRAIDLALGSLAAQSNALSAADQDVRGLLGPLLDAIKQAGLGNPAALGMLNQSDELQRTALDAIEEEEEEPKYLTEVLENEKLTDDQKDNLADAVEQDIEVMHRVLELEKKRQEEEIKAALMSSAVAPVMEVESDEDLAKKHAEEQRQLLESLRNDANSQEMEPPVAVPDTPSSSKVEKNLKAYLHRAIALRSKAISTLFDLLNQDSDHLQRLNAIRQEKGMSSDATSAISNLSRAFYTSLSEKQTRFEGEISSYLASLDSSHAETDTLDSFIRSVADFFSPLRKQVQNWQAQTDRSITQMEDYRVRELTVLFDGLKGDDVNAILALVRSENFRHVHPAVANIFIDFLDREETQLKALVESVYRAHEAGEEKLPAMEVTLQGNLQVLHLQAVQVGWELHRQIMQEEFWAKKEAERNQWLYDATITKRETAEQIGARLADWHRKALEDEDAWKKQAQAELHNRISQESTRMQGESSASGGDTATRATDFESERCRALISVAIGLSQARSKALDAMLSTVFQAQQSWNNTRGRLGKLDAANGGDSAEVVSAELQLCRLRMVRDVCEHHLAQSTIYQQLDLWYGYSIALNGLDNPNEVAAHSVLDSLGASTREFLEITVRAETLRKRARILKRSANHRDLESDRMRAMLFAVPADGGSSANAESPVSLATKEFLTMCANVQMHADEDLNALKVATAADIWKHQQEFDQTHEEMFRSHETYLESISPLYQVALRSKDTAKSLPAGKILNAVWQSDIDCEEQSVGPFKQLVSQMLTHVHVLEEVNTLKRQLRQEGEIMEMTLEEAELARLKALVDAQIARQEELEAKAFEFEVESIGLEDAIERREAAQVAYQTALAAARQAEREKDLLKQGYTPQEASEMAAKEAEQRLVDDNAKMTERSQQLAAKHKLALKDEMQQAEMESEIARELVAQVEQGQGADASAVREHLLQSLYDQKRTQGAAAQDEYDRSVIATVKQLEAQRQAKETALRNELADKEASRVDELMQQGVPEDRARATAAAERQTAESAGLQSIADEYAENMKQAKAALENEFNNMMKIIEDAYNVRTDMLKKGEQFAHDQQRQRLQKRLAERKKKRVAELVAQGVSQEDAEHQATGEMDTWAADETSRMEQEQRKAKADLVQLAKQEDTARAKAVREQHSDSLQQLSDVLTAKKESEHRRLAQRLGERKRAAMENILHAGDPNRPKDPVDEQETDEMKQASTQNLTQKKQDELLLLQRAADAAWKNEQDAQHKKEQDEMQQLHTSLAVQEQARRQELIEKEGLSPEEATVRAKQERLDQEQVAVAELKDKHSKARQASQLQHDEALEREKEAIEERFKVAQKILDNGLQAAHDEQHRHLQDKLRKRHAARVEELTSGPDAVSHAEAETIATRETQADFVKQSQEAANLLQSGKFLAQQALDADYEAQIKSLDHRHEVSLKGLEAALVDKRQRDQKHLADRLAKRRKEYAQKLIEGGLPVDTAQQLAADALSDLDAMEKANWEAEFDRDAQRQRDELQQDRARFQEEVAEEKQLDQSEMMALRGTLRDQYQRQLIGSNETANDLVQSAVQATKGAQNQAVQEIDAIRQAYQRDIEQLGISLEAEANKEKANLSKRLQAKRHRREQELRSQGKGQEEIKSSIEEEERAQQQELDNRLASEMNSKLAAKRAEAAEAERKIVEAEASKAHRAAEDASRSKEQAQQRIQQLRSQHESEAKALETRMAREHADREENLKKRLADRRQSQLRQAADVDAKKKLERQLAEEEKQRMIELQKELAAEEERRKEEQRREQDAKLAAALDEVKKAEMAAAIAAAKEAAMKSMQEEQLKNEQEQNLKEAQKRREVHTMIESTMKEQEERHKVAQKSKLQDRLQAKKVKRDKDQKEAEAKALAELQAKQLAESQAREQARLARMTWVEKVQAVMERVKTMHVTVSEGEDYCCREVLTQPGLVPDAQLNEAVSMVLKDRHDAEMTQLLTSNFDERLVALRNAVEQVIESKAATKMALLEAYGAKEGVEDVKDPKQEEELKQKLLALDDDFMRRQVNAEKQATSALEDRHMRAQMDLRKRQLSEVATIVALYTDPATLQRIQASSGQSQEEALQAYQRKIEDEKKARESAMEAERVAAEHALRAKLQEEMSQIQQAMEAERQQHEAEIEKKRQEILRQKEEMQRKQEDEMGTLDKQEKARILAAFEKEEAAKLEALNRDKADKKARLSNRLSMRRASTATPHSPQQALAGASAAASTSSGFPVPQTQPSGDLVRSGEIVSKTKTTRPPATHVADPALSSALPEIITTQISQSMQVFENKLERIEKVLAALEKGGVFQAQQQQQQQQWQELAMGEATSKTAASASAAPSVPAYHDQEEPPAGDALDIASEIELPVQERARLDFGLRLASMVGVRNLKILAAKSLPPSAATGNAFCNSYQYTVDENTLFVHKSRLSSSGDFGLVVIHALSHIKVNPQDLSNDMDPRFMAEFYKNMKILSQDLYKKSASAQSASTMLTTMNHARLNVGGTGGGTGGGGHLSANPSTATLPTVTNLNASTTSNATASAPTPLRRRASLRGSFSAMSPMNQTTGSMAIGAGQNSNSILTAMNHAIQNFETINEDGSSSPVHAGPPPHLQHQSSLLNASTSTVALSQPAYQQPPAEYFSTESIVDRMRQYAAQGGIPLDYFDRYTQQQQQQQQQTPQHNN
jgi:hypothetical protein